MAGLTPLQNLAKNGTILRVITGQTTSGTSGTRTAITHGLTDHNGNAVTPASAIPIVTSADADGALGSPNTGTVTVVKMDATTVTVRGSAASVPFTLLVF